MNATFRMQSGTAASFLSFSDWDVGFAGLSLDTRGSAALQFIAENVSQSSTISYSADPPLLTIDSSPFVPDDLFLRMQDLGGKRLLLEATTLGFVELFLLLSAILEAGIQTISILYIEPGGYRQPNDLKVLHKRDFELTDEVEDFTALPGAVRLLQGDTTTKAAFLVGYEGQRLEQAIEQSALRPSDCSTVFGVPAFKAGWEMDSFANNVRVIRQHDLTGEVLFCGAQNPLGAYDALAKVYNSCSAPRKERMIIAPIGTKPHGIGAAVFACVHRDVGVIYDHPQRSRGRSEDLAAWHLYDVSFTGTVDS